MESYIVVFHVETVSKCRFLDAYGDEVIFGGDDVHHPVKQRYRLRRLTLARTIRVFLPGFLKQLVKLRRGPVLEGEVHGDWQRVRV